MVKPSNYKAMKIESQKEIANICIREFYYEKKEISRIYFLNVKNIVIQVLDMTTSATSYVNMSIKEIIAKAVELRADKMILVHNHPSGSTKPSKQDIKFTDELFNAGKLLDIDLVDHIIVSKNGYTSVYTYLKEEISKIKENN
mgnify:FL=1